MALTTVTTMHARSNDEWFIDHLREHKESVRFFGLTLESLLKRLILPEGEQPLFVEMMQKQLGMSSVEESIADHL